MNADRIAVYLASILPATDNDPVKGMQKIAELGFKGVQFYHYNTKQHPAHMEMDEAERKKMLIDVPGELGLTVTALACDNSHEKGDTVEERSKILFETIDLAVDCNIPIVIIHGGERIEENEENNQCAWKRLIENLEYGCKYANDKGIQLAMEPGGGIWMVHGWKILKRLKNEIGDLFKVNLDPANITMGLEDPVEGVYQLGDSIVHLHIKDARIVKKCDNVIQFGKDVDKATQPFDFSTWREAIMTDTTDKINIFKETPSGEGMVNFPALMKALRDVGFDGWMAIEREGGEVRVEDLLKAKECVSACV